MSSAVLKGNASGTGVVTLQSPNTNTDRTITLPDSSATLAVAGPAFHAVSSSAQNVTQNTTVKVNYTSETFDTDSCYDATNSKFIPNVAGYYFITAAVWFETFNSQPLEAVIFKNGGSAGASSSYTGSQSAHNQQVSTLVYCNGSTDYIEVYCYVAGSITGQLGTGTSRQWFSGCLVRAA